MPLYNLMEDAATAEISRAQLWQWVHHGAVLDDGRVVTPELVRELARDEMDQLRTALGAERFDSGKFELAGKMFDDFVTGEELDPFLTSPAYKHLLTTGI